MLASQSEVSNSDDSTRILGGEFIFSNFHDSLAKLKSVLITSNEMNYTNNQILFQILNFLKKIEFLPETRTMMEISSQIYQINTKKIIFGEKILKNIEEIIQKSQIKQTEFRESSRPLKIFGIVDMKSSFNSCTQQENKNSQDKISKIIPKFMAKKCPNIENIPRLKIENVPNRKIGIFSLR